VTVSTIVPDAAAAAPSVRFGALRGKVPLPWGTVVALAVLLALADAFLVVAVQGAEGAIERAQTPFLTWLRYSAVLVPVFGLAVTWVLSRAHRKHGSAAMLGTRRTVATALLIAAVATAIGLAALIASTTYDYHLQTQLLAKTQGLHSHSAGIGGTADSAYTDGGWSPAQRDTMLVAVKAVEYGSVVLVGVNAVLVAWVTALRGGRLGRARAARRG
jgi:hypothetical protein